jgi:hypothetical protein
VLGRQQQMDVVGHQAIRVKRTAGARQHSRQVEEIKLAIDVIKEAAGLVVTALHDVDRDAGDHDAGAPAPKRSTTRAQRR